MCIEILEVGSKPNKFDINCLYFLFYYSFCKISASNGTEKISLWTLRLPVDQAVQCNQRSLTGHELWPRNLVHLATVRKEWISDHSKILISLTEIDQNLREDFLQSLELLLIRCCVKLKQTTENKFYWSSRRTLENIVAMCSRSILEADFLHWIEAIYVYIICRYCSFTFVLRRKMVFTELI